MLAMLLSQVNVRGSEDVADELEFLSESGESAPINTGWKDTPEASTLLPGQQQCLMSYARHVLFKPVQNHLRNNESDRIPFLESANPEKNTPTLRDPSSRT